MRTDIPKFLFHVRDNFRSWLEANSETSEGIWLIFGKTKAVVSLSANDALEEAFCFGWIDGQMQRIDDAKYLKYFTKRRVKSVWSEKNKKLVIKLREKGLMTKLGEKAVEIAVKNGMWNAQQSNTITDEQTGSFVKKLIGITPAYENLCAMSQSVQRTYARRYYSFKTEEARQKDFVKIVERLNNNLRPM